MRNILSLFKKSPREEALEASDDTKAKAKGSTPPARGQAKVCANPADQIELEHLRTKVAELEEQLSEVTQTAEQAKARNSQLASELHQAKFAEMKELASCGLNAPVPDERRPSEAVNRTDAFYLGLARRMKSGELK